MFDLDEFLRHFERVHERTQRVAACIPADRVEWSYKAGAFTLGDLVRHIAVTERLIWAETVHHRPVAYTSHGRELADGRAAVLAFFDRLHQDSLARFRALTPERPEGTCVPPAGPPPPAWQWLRVLAAPAAPAPRAHPPPPHTTHPPHHAGQRTTPPAPHPPPTQSRPAAIDQRQPSFFPRPTPSRPKHKP